MPFKSRLVNLYFSFLNLPQARLRWRALGKSGVVSQQASSVGAGRDDALLLADVRDLLVRLPSVDRELLASSSQSGSRIAMVFQASMLRLLCCLHFLMTCANAEILCSNKYHF
jgi:hypothetical protein